MVELRCGDLAAPVRTTGIVCDDGGGFAVVADGGSLNNFCLYRSLLVESN